MPTGTRGDSRLRTIRNSLRPGPWIKLPTTAWTELYRLSLVAFPDLRVTIEDVVGTGDQVVVRWRMAGTHGGTFAGIDATHQPIDVRGMTWLRFENGRIVEGWDSWNQGGLIADLRAGVAHCAVS